MDSGKPPRKVPSPYITPEGAAALKREMRHLWSELRPEVVGALRAAAAEGDRSENAEYTYRKKQLGGIDRRIRYLSKRLDAIKVVDRLPPDRDAVRFGAWVSLLGGPAGTATYRIVGADEIDARKGWISIDSPLAAALVGKRAGDRVEVRLPEGMERFEVAGVSYTGEE
jgi:transcription elongation factor GreB